MKLIPMITSRNSISTVKSIVVNFDNLTKYDLKNKYLVESHFVYRHAERHKLTQSNARASSTPTEGWGGGICASLRDA